VIEVWDSCEPVEAFGEKGMAVRGELGFGGERPPITYLEVHKILEYGRSVWSLEVAQVNGYLAGDGGW
jgi:hypothetical protein